MPTLPEQFQAAMERIQGAIGGAENRIERSRKFLNDISRGSNYTFVPGDKFAIDPTTGIATYNVEFYLERGYSERQMLFALAHELRDHLVEHDKLVATPEGEIAAENQQIELANKEWLRIWRNSREDIAGNLSILKYLAPSLRPATERLYRKKLFPNRDFTQLPRHVQFSYAVLVKTMLPNATDIKISPEVQEVLDRLSNTEFEAPDNDGTLTNMENPLAYVTAPDDLYSANERALWRLQVSRDLIEPEIEKLYQQDLANPNKNWSKGNNDDSFSEVYKQYDDSIHPDPWDNPNEPKKEKKGGKDKSDDKTGEDKEAENEDEEEKEADADIDEDELHGDMEQKMRAAFMRQNNLTEGEMSVLDNYDSVYKQIQPYLDKLKTIFLSIVDRTINIEEDIAIRQRRGRLTSEGIHSAYVYSKRGISEPPPGRTNLSGEIIHEEVRPIPSTWHLVADQSSSMQGERTRAQLRSAVLFIEVLAEIEEQLKSMRNIHSSAIDIKSDLRGFSSGVRIYKKIEDILSPQKRIEIFQGLSRTFLDTNDYDALEQIANEIDKKGSNYKNEIATRHRKEIVVVLSDGQSNSSKLLKEQIERLRDMGVKVIGLGMTESAISIIDSYSPEGRVCKDISDLPKYLAEIILEDLVVKESEETN